MIYNPTKNPSKTPANRTQRVSSKAVEGPDNKALQAMVKVPT